MAPAGLGPTEEATVLPIVQDHPRPVPHTPPSHHHPRPWHKGSVFGDGPRRPLDADQRRAWLARAELERRASRLTALHVVVGRALLCRLGVDGQCDPSHATLAADAGASESTVRRALAALRDAGLLAWEQRLVRRPWPQGGPGASRAEQTSNAYALTLPTGPIRPVAAPAYRSVQLRLHCGSQADCETPSEMTKQALPALSEETSKRLTAIMKARKVQLDTEWLAKRAEQWRTGGIRLTCCT